MTLKNREIRIIFSQIFLLNFDHILIFQTNLLRTSVAGPSTFFFHSLYFWCLICVLQSLVNRRQKEKEDCVRSIFKLGRSTYTSCNKWRFRHQPLEMVITILEIYVLYSKKPITEQRGGVVLFQFIYLRESTCLENQDSKYSFLPMLKHQLPALVLEISYNFSSEADHIKYLQNLV